MKFVDYDIVFQEIPDEVTLAINIANCPFRCAGCHSPHLQRDEGEPLDDMALTKLLNVYVKQITCVCFMGGDATPEAVCRCAQHIRSSTAGRVKTAWYSGRNTPYEKALTCFDYVKTGAYNEALGGLRARETNQRLYKIEHNQLTDITSKMWRGETRNKG